MCRASETTPFLHRPTAILAILPFLLLLLLHLVLDDASGVATKYAEYDISVKYGLLRGRLTRTVRGRYVASFRGVPYALPPLGPLRFKNPQPWNYTWDGWYDARMDRSMCMQQDQTGRIVGDEDCLYLNVYVPTARKKLNSTESYPVMVFVHGGAFNTGSSDSGKFAPDYLLDQNIILVTLNYRLSAFGFFSTTSRASPGNYGLKDVLVALHWVHENIQFFGGDPKRVTLCGQSSGAATVHLLSLTNKTEGLFDKYILHSGSALAAWAVHPRRNIRRASLEMARLLGCLPQRIDNVENLAGYTEQRPHRESRELSGELDYASNDEAGYSERDEEEMMVCMRDARATKIASLYRYYWIWRQNPWCVFGPTIEDDLEDAILTMHPLASIKNRLFRDIPRIVGTVDDEGLVKSLGFYLDPSAKVEFLENYEAYVPYLVEHHEIISNTTAFAEAVDDFYFLRNLSEYLLPNVTKLIGDALLAWPTYRAVKYQSGLMNSATYFFRFSYKGTFSSTFSTGIPKHYGVAHSDDLNYLFPMLNNMYSDQMLHNTENDTTIINIMTEMWYHFMVHGVPKAWRVPAWPRFDQNRKFLRIGNDRSPDITVDQNLYPERMAFWEFVTREMIVEATDTELNIQDSPSDAEPDEGSWTRADQLFTCLLVLIVCRAF